MSPEERSDEEPATGEGQPLAPYRPRQGLCALLPLTDRVALALKRAAHLLFAPPRKVRGLLSPEKRGRGKSASASQAGFTLLEMLVVLGLLGLIAAVSMPLLRGGAENGLIERTAARLAADLTTLRVAAIKQNTEAHLDIDLAVNRYWGTPRLGLRPLPAGIPIAVKDTGATAASLASIRFFPDGSSGGGRVIIGSGGQSRIVSIDRLTGLIRIKRAPS